MACPIGGTWLIHIPESLRESLSPDVEVVRLLGEGASARVYLGRDTILHRPVAVKLLRDRFAADETALRRFEREARASAKLSHPNVATIFRVGRTGDGLPFLVYEFLRGRNLEDTLAASGPMPEAKALVLLEQLAAALEAAHTVGLIHRDVKPANIMWDADDSRAVLTDFGLARALETTGDPITKVTKVGDVLGDPSAISPEQMQGLSLTEATDIFSLGVLGYSVLTGRTPYKGDSLAAMVHAKLHGDPTPLRDIRPDLSPDVATLLERCLDRRPERRPTAPEVRRGFRAIRDGETGPFHGGRSNSSFSEAVDKVPALRMFLDELKRRHVYNVMVLYVVVAFMALQIGELVVPALPVPDWTYPALVAVTMAGFPLASVLAWMFDVTSSGIQRSEEAVGPAAMRIRLFQWLGVAASLGFGLLIGWWILGT